MATYYASGSGSDSNNGTSPNTPWRNAPGMPQASGSAAITLSAGDIVYLMDGTWTTYGNGAGWDINASGTQSSPIIISAYDGCNPILDNRSDLSSAAWTYVGSGIWTTPLTATSLQALWVDGQSFKPSGGATPSYGEAGLVSNVLYVGFGLSRGSTIFAVTNGGSAAPGYCVRIRDRSYVHLRGLTTRGGNYAGIILQMGSAAAVLTGCKIIDCDVGYQTSGISLSGINTNPTGGIKSTEIKSCYVHSDITTSGDYTSSEGRGDGIAAVNAIDGLLIENCVVRDFRHSQLEVNTTSSPTGTFMQGIRMLWNDVSAPARLYGRGIGVAGSGVSGIAIVGNRIHDHPTRNQVGSIGGVFCGNIVERVTGTVVYGGVRGEGLMLQTWDTGKNQSYVSGLFVCNNVFADTKNAAIALLTSNSVNMGANTIANNITIRPSTYDCSVTESSGSIATQTIVNNCFTGDSIYDRGSAKSVSTANSGSEYENNITSDPLLDSSYRPKAGSPVIGAGTYIPGAKHMGGQPMNASAPDIGAYRYHPAPGTFLFRAH